MNPVSSLKTTLDKALWLGVIFGFSVAGYSSVHLTIADKFYRQDTPESVQAAVAWEPGNADYHALLAEHQESAGFSPEPELLLASSLSPLTSSFLVRAALRAEVDRDYPGAERLLRRATAIDRKFAPGWALLNFYFRRGSETGVWPEGFWPSVYSALEMSSPEDTDAVFHLAWEQTQDAQAILARLPTDPVVQKAYLRFLIRTARVEAAGAVALRLAAVVEAADTPLVLNYCDRTIPVNSAPAVNVWNLLARRKLIAGTALNPANGIILTNKDFTANSPPGGFDWVVLATDGVFVTQAASGHGISVHFDGSEPEDCILLKQIMPVIVGRQFKIDYQYFSFGHPLRGIQWEVTSGNQILAESPELAAESDDTPGHLIFKAERDSVGLALRYRRPKGTVRAEGTIAIERLADQILK
jgi:hypothetical protein